MKKFYEMPETLVENIELTSIIASSPIGDTSNSDEIPVNPEGNDDDDI